MHKSGLLIKSESSMCLLAARWTRTTAGKTIYPSVQPHDWRPCEATERPGHNLHRALVQFRLAASVERQRAAIEALVERL